MMAPVHPITAAHPSGDFVDVGDTGAGPQVIFRDARFSAALPKPG